MEPLEPPGSATVWVVMNIIAGIARRGSPCVTSVEL